MNLKQLSRELKVSVTKLRSVVETVIGSIPETFTEEEIEKIKNALADTAQVFLPEGTEPNSEIVPIEMRKKMQVASILGERVLQRNAMLFNSILVTTLKQTLTNSANALEQTENIQAQMVASTYDRMSRNMIAVHRELNVELNVENPTAYLESLSEDDREWLLCELAVLGVPREDIDEAA